MDIRLATPDDLPAIVEIYNASIPSLRATADTTPVTIEARQAWLAAHQPPSRPVWVAEQGDQVVGWVSLSTFYARPAYDPTVEISLYVRPDAQHRGVGRALAQHALVHAPAGGIMTVLAIIFGHNELSLRLFESLGFERWGHLPGVTHMPDGRRDVEILGLHLT